MRRWSPHPFTLRQLQYVLAVAEYRSFPPRGRGVCESRSRRSPRRVAQFRVDARGPGLRAAAAARRRHRGGRPPSSIARRAYAPRGRRTRLERRAWARDPFAGAPAHWRHPHRRPVFAAGGRPGAPCGLPAPSASLVRGEDHRDRGAPDVRRARGPASSPSSPTSGISNTSRSGAIPSSLLCQPATGSRAPKDAGAPSTSSEARRCSFSTMVTAFEIQAPGRVPAGRSRRSERARDEPLDARPDGRWWRRDHAAPRGFAIGTENRGARTRHTSVRRARARRERSPLAWRRTAPVARGSSREIARGDAANWS